MNVRLVLALAAIAASVACSSHGGGGSPTPTPTSTPTPTPVPTPPSLGALLDRAGRPLGEVALIETFQSNASTKLAQRTAWETDANLAQWPATWVPTIVTSLGYWDGLDNACANEVLYAGPTTVNSYGAFASLLADDRLYVDSDITTCTKYLAIEISVFTGVAPTDCGGRTPTEDAIDVTYTALGSTLANLGSSTWIPDGVTTNGAESVTFPFLGAP